MIIKFDDIKGGEFYSSGPGGSNFGFLVKLKDSVLSFLIHESTGDIQIYKIKRSIFDNFGPENLDKPRFIWVAIDDDMVTNKNSKHVLIENIFMGRKVRYMFNEIPKTYV